MKLLSVTVPCYNSEKYMRKAVECLLPGADDVEIIIVDDGSTDGTALIADEYAEKYPSVVKVIHQENGGHGEAVNTGLANATGLFFKVLDSDDWFKEEAYLSVIERLKELSGGSRVVDLFVCNFVYEKEGKKHKKVMTYRSAFPVDEIFTWDDVKIFKPGQYILMHSAIYRTKLLKDMDLKLPAHTFYVDNIFVFNPLTEVKNLYYMDVNLYRYYIGRADQSVNESVMIGRVDQQLRVNKLMIDYMAHASRNLKKKQEKYMLSYLDIMMTISSILLIKDGTEESLEKKKELWNYLKDNDPRDYIRLRFGLLGTNMNLPGKGGRKISEMEYRIAQRFVGFN
ncbi:MAG: glycosyltransferase family 2 protein [Lachnospiraceae bacterium]|nr:glycosyltransferase family 2 protein [Lachnospiraceae bacterium]